MATVYERRDAAGNVVERAFVPSARPDRDALVREQAAAGVNGWGEADGEPKPKPRARAKKTTTGDGGEG